jgi:hypothetical protein
MPTRLALALGCAFTVLLAYGCGSIANLNSKDPQVYGGLACDPLLQGNPLATGASTDLSGIHGEGKEGAILAAAVILFIPTIFVADISTDLVLDTVTLPLAYYLNKRAHAGEKDPDPIPDPGPQEPRPLFVPGCLLQNRDLPALTQPPGAVDFPTTPHLPLPPLFALSPGCLTVPAAAPKHSAEWMLGSQATDFSPMHY